MAPSAPSARMHLPDVGGAVGAIADTPILMYHSVGIQVTKAFAPFVIAPALFAAQMDYLHAHGYHPITVGELVRARMHADDRLPDRPIALTFDDGYADFAAHALPILQRYGFTATLYLTTDAIGETSRWLQSREDAERCMLTWAQVRDISACGIECGAHGMTHRALDRLTFDAARREILLAKTHLEEQLEQPIYTFAYPFGYYSAPVRQLVADVGYSAACAVHYRLSPVADDPFALSRLMVLPEYDLRTYARLLTQRGYRSPQFYRQVRSRAWHAVRQGALRLEHRRLREE